MICLVRTWFRRLAGGAVRIGGRVASRLARHPGLRAIARRSIDVYPPLGRLALRLICSVPRDSSDFRGPQTELALSPHARRIFQDLLVEMENQERVDN